MVRTNGARRLIGDGVPTVILSPERAQCDSLGQRPRNRIALSMFLFSPERAPCGPGGNVPECVQSPFRAEMIFIQFFVDLGRCPRLSYFAPLGLELGHRNALRRQDSKGETPLFGAGLGQRLALPECRSAQQNADPLACSRRRVNPDFSSSQGEAPSQRRMKRPQGARQLLIFSRVSLGD